MSVPALTDAGRRPLDPRLALRCVTAGLGTVAALWHLSGAFSLQPAPAARVLAAASVGLALLAWSALLLLRPSRRLLVAGALAGGALLGLTGVLVARAAPGTIAPAALAGLVLQGALLLLVLAGLAPRLPAPALTVAVRGGGALAAVALSVVVAGGASAHHPPAAGAGTPGAVRAAFVCSLL